MSSNLAERQRLHINPNPLGDAGTSSIVESDQSLEVYYYNYPIQAERTIATTISPRRQSFLTKRDPIVDQYFYSSPESRIEYRKKAAARIKSFDAVFTVLDWSLRGDVADAYGAAVDLLGECGIILVTSLQYFYLEYPKTKRDGSQIDSDTKLDVLINGLARAHKLSAETRLKAVIQLAGSKSRVVKAAIIDAAALLVNKRNKRTVKALLNWFTSDKETDTYIRQYAEDVCDDLM